MNNPLPDNRFLLPLTLDSLNSSFASPNEEKFMRKPDEVVEQRFKNDEVIEQGLKNIEHLLLNQSQNSSHQNWLLYNQNEDLRKTIQELKDILQKQTTDLDLLRKAADDLAALEKIKEEKALKVKMRKEQPKRDRLTAEEFFQLLKLNSDKSFASTRSFVMFVLLYITGLRAGNLVKVTVRHVLQLLESGKTELKIIKKGPDRLQIVLSPAHLDLLRKCKGRIDFLFMRKKINDLAFTPEFSSRGKCSEYVFKIALNQRMKALCKITGKRLSNHSFRITFISDHLETQDIHTVKKIVGHKNILSTETYDRVRVHYNKVHQSLDSTRNLCDLLSDFPQEFNPNKL